MSHTHNTNPRFWGSRGSCCVAMGYITALTILFLSTATLAQRYALDEDPIRLGVKALVQVQLEEAKNHFNEALAGDYQVDRAKFGLAEVAVREGRFFAAEPLYREAIAARHKLDLIYLLAPTSTDARVKTVAEHSRGFIYLVSVAGVTGAREGLPPGLEPFVGRVRKTARQPLCVGFGISTPEQAAQVSRFADGVIVGSRILQLMEADVSLAKVGDFVRQLRTAIDR